MSSEEYPLLVDALLNNSLFYCTSACVKTLFTCIKTLFRTLSRLKVKYAENCVIVNRCFHAYFKISLANSFNTRHFDWLLFSSLKGKVVEAIISFIKVKNPV